MRNKQKGFVFSYTVWVFIGLATAALLLGQRILDREHRESVSTQLWMEVDALSKALRYYHIATCTTGNVVQASLVDGYLSKAFNNDLVSEYKLNILAGPVVKVEVDLVLKNNLNYLGVYISESLAHGASFADKTLSISRPIIEKNAKMLRVAKDAKLFGSNPC